LFYIKTKLGFGAWEHKYIKYILGEHYYFVKLSKITSKSNQNWMIILVVFLLFSSVFSIHLAFFIYNHKDIITETHINSIK
jgi:hypothetical protein